MKMKFYHAGLWIPFVWLYWTSTHTRLSVLDVPWQLVYLTFVLVLILAFFLFKRIKHKGRILVLTPRQENGIRIIDWSSALVMCISALTMVTPQLFGSESSLIPLVGTLFGGAAFGWVFLRWTYVISGAETRGLIVLVVVASIFRAVAQPVLMTLPFEISQGIVALLPLVSCFMLQQSTSHPLGTTNSSLRYKSTQFYGMWRIWLILFAVSLTMSVLVSAGTQVFALMSLQVLYGENVLTTVILVGVLIWVTKTTFSFTFTSLWRILLILLACLLSIIILIPQSEIIHALINCSFEIMVAFILISVCDISRHSDLNPYASLSYGLLFYAVPSLLGAAVYEVFLSSFVYASIGALLLLMLFIVLAVSLDPNDLTMRYVFEDLRGKVTLSTDFNALDLRCIELGKEHGLTNREVEVLQMVCVGRTRASIAEAFFITESTVKTHVSHIYAKLGVSSRQELQKLIGM